jgi:meiotic recombination protein DMC1
LYARAFTHEQQMQLIVMAVAQMSEDQYRLLIIGSITALFRIDFLVAESWLSASRRLCK